MKHTIYHIKDTIEEVRTLNLTPMAAINAIDEALDDANLSVGMSPVAWLGLCLCSLILGGTIGWGARIHTTSGRYVLGQAKQYETTIRYYSERTNQMIKETERSIKSGK